MDSDFIELGKVQERCGKRRFTLAHEVAHQILFQMQSDEEKAQLRKMYSTRKAHTIRELKSAEDWNEWQANARGASLLMPRASVTTFIATFEEAVDEKHSPLVNDIGFYTDYIVDRFCEYFHVSKSSAVIRLQQLGYLTEGNTLRKAVSCV